MANGNQPSGLMPATGVQPEKEWYNYLPFVDEKNRQEIAAAFLGPEAAGQQSQFQRAGFYDYLRQAAEAGRGIAGQQQSLADILAARARGEGGPSLAEMQLQQTLEQNRRAAAGALAGAGRGINPALAQRLLLQQQSTLGQQAAGQGAILRAQEQLAAQQALGQQLAGMRGAEQAQFGTSGQLGLGQEKLGVETQEAQRQRELEVALANQRAEQERQRLQQQQEESIQGASERQREALGDAAIEAGKFGMQAAKLGLFAEGGKVEAKKKMPKAKIIAAHAAAKKAMPNFQEQYGEEKGKAVAYATMMKMAKKNKLAEGDLAKLDNKKNDVVPAMLSEGEAVIPRSIMMSPKPAQAAAKFVDALIKNKDKKTAKMEALKVALGKKK
jgi:hypothetical protein